MVAKLRENKFIKNVVVLATGIAASHAISLAFAPILTRIYGPEAFGVLGSFLALLAILSPIASMSYPVAIVLPKRNSEAVGLIRLSIFSSIIISSILFLYFIYLGEITSKILNMGELAPYFYLIPLATLLITFYQIMEQWLIRHQEFKKIGVVAFINSAGINLLKTGVGLIHPTGKILIMITIAGNLLQSILLFASIGNKGIELNVNKSLTLKELIVKYKDFPLYRAPQSCINAISQSLPVLMLLNFFGPISAGFYVLAKMVMGAPSALLAKSVGDVFYPKITKARNDGEAIAPLIKRTTIGLFLLGVFPFIIIFIYGPQLFGMIFGSEWIVAGEYARWLSLFYLFNFINKACVAAVPVLVLQKELLIYEIFSTSTKILALSIGFYIFQSDVIAIVLYSIFGVAAYTIMMAWIYNFALQKDGNEKTS